MVCHEQKWNRWIVFFGNWNHHKWTQIRGITEKQAFIAYDSSYYHYFHAQWCSLPSIQNCEEISREELCDYAGLAGNSPDLIPIKNLWAKMKDLVAEKQPSGGKALIETIKEVWVKEISSDYCNSLIVSMPYQLQVVIKLKGGHTKH